MHTCLRTQSISLMTDVAKHGRVVWQLRTVQSLASCSQMTCMLLVCHLQDFVNLAVRGTACTCS